MFMIVDSLRESGGDERNLAGPSSVCTTITVRRQLEKAVNDEHVGKRASSRLTRFCSWALLETPLPLISLNNTETLENNSGLQDSESKPATACTREGVLMIV